MSKIVLIVMYFMYTTNLWQTTFGASFSWGNSMLIEKQLATCSSKYSCHDCHSVQVCRPDRYGKLEPLQVLNCPSTKPFCVFGKCSGDPAADNCAKKDPFFVCMSNGYFPHPSDCRKYYYCDELTAWQYQCINDGENFDPTVGHCVKNAPCDKLFCSQNGIRIAFPHYPQYYGMCNDGPTPVLIDRCENNFQFDEFSQSCTEVCTEEGVVLDPSDCTKYYLCKSEMQSDGKLKLNMLEHSTCPKGKAFDLNVKDCVDITQTDCCTHASC